MNKPKLEIIGKMEPKPECKDEDLSYVERLELIESLRAEIAEMKSDLEKGFMAGAYTRLKNLQSAETELSSLKDWVKSEIEGIDSQFDLSHDFLRNLKLRLGLEDK